MKNSNQTSAKSVMFYGKTSDEYYKKRKSERGLRGVDDDLPGVESNDEVDRF